MTPPDPFGSALPGKMTDRRGLRVVNDNDVLFRLQQSGALFIHFQINILFGLPQLVVAAL
jgi:hypothetical protein